MSYNSPHALAQELRDELDAEIRGQEFIDAATPVVTINPVDVAPALTSGQPVILIPPPAVEYVTSDAIDCEWGILVIAPIRDAIEAWPRIDELTNVVADAVGAASSRYGNFQPPHGDPWPCSIVTVTTTTS